MRIAVLSGKGGTGKTLVSVNLAYVKGDCAYIDCDVEEPNGRLFLKPQTEWLEQVKVMVPVADDQKCTGCRKCVEFCKFNALAYIKNKLLVFPELCHACRGCVILCPESALAEACREIGHIEHGRTQGIEVKTGVLNTGEATGVPIIRKLLATLPQDKTAVVDCPPGSACSVMESIKDADYCLMVTEPTSFGVHNLDMIYRLVQLFKKPNALVLNKDMGVNSPVDQYCAERGIRLIATIPYDPQLALLNSRGQVAAAESSCYRKLFTDMLATIEKEVCHEAAGHTER